jgi:RNA polymerase sigma-70 factor (ECF subfamily)
MPSTAILLTRFGHSCWNSRTIERGQLRFENKTLVIMKTNLIPVLQPASEADGMQIMGLDASNLHESKATVAAPEIMAPAQPQEVADWSDAQLIASVRCEPPNEAALDVLLSRYWNVVFARCQMLAQNYDKALDLAQATWCRLLRARPSLKPDGNFPAYLATIATNLFRDSYRASRRAGPMADGRLESLDAAPAHDDGETLTLADIIVDLKSLRSQEQTLLAIDIDRALQQLTPQLREVVIARFIDGESCAEIGLRHGRTEQSVSGWVREALRQMKSHLEEPGLQGDGEGKEEESQDPAPAMAFSEAGSVA